VQPPTSVVVLDTYPFYWDNLNSAHMEVTGLRRPHSVCLDRKGCMYVTDLSGIVTKFDSDGKLAKRCVCVCGVPSYDMHAHTFFGVYISHMG
jgi:hypothetical protein